MAKGPDMNQLMQQVQQMQTQMAQAQEDLKNETVEASAGGGMVKVTMTGDMALREITISPDAIDPEDPELLQDMVTAAVNEAIRSAQELASSKLGGITGGMGGLPGMGGDARSRRLAPDLSPASSPGLSGSTGAVRGPLPQLRHRRQDPDDLGRLADHLPVGEPKRRQSGGRVSLVPPPIPCLLELRAVVAEPVGLDHEAEVRARRNPRRSRSRVTPVSGCGRPARRAIGRNRRSSSDSVNTNVSLSRRSRRARTPALSRPRGELGSKLVGTDQSQLVGLVHGALEAGGGEVDRQVDQGPRR